MRKKTVLIIVLSLLATLMFSILPLTRAQKTEVKIGWSMPLTGPVAPTAYVHHLYYWMVIDDFNANGGLYVPEEGKKLPITYTALNDEYDQDKMLTNYEALLEQGVDLLFAPWSTAHNVAALPIYEENQYPVVGLTVGSNTLQDLLQTGTYNYFFLTLAQPREDTEELVEVFQHINSKVPAAINISRVGIAYRSDEHGIEHAEAIEAGLVAAGIAVPVYQSYNPFATIDWAGIVSAFRGATVDGCIVCGYDEVAGFVWECITQDYNPKLIMHGPALETSFLVYGPLGFTPGQFAGLMYYNGFPASAYKTPIMEQWVYKHREYTKVFYGGAFPYGYPPFPASAVFYAGLEVLLRAVEKYGLLNRPTIRDALEFETFNITLGMNTTVGTFNFRRGLSPVIEQHGTITQWQGGELMEVIWPTTAASTSFIIYPKYPWSWAKVNDINRDGFVDILDLATAGKAFGADVGEKRYRFPADVNKDGTVDILDIATIAKDYGKKAFP